MRNFDQQEMYDIFSEMVEHLSQINISVSGGTGGSGGDVTVNSDPIYQSNTFQKFVIASADMTAAVTKLLIPANLDRKGFTVYNNSTNSLYVGIESDIAGGLQIGQLGTNAGVTAIKEWLGPCVYTGAIYVRRNSGSGAVIGYEFT